MIDMQTGLHVGKQVAPNGANICYGILSCYKQVAPDGAHLLAQLQASATHRQINFSKD